MTAVNPKGENANTFSEDQKGGLTMGKVIELRLTKKAVYRAAAKEIQRMYQLSAGGTDPIIDETSRWAFERGEIEEVMWKDWESYCVTMLNKIERT
jgi:hypothetical protein